jgi:ATP-binding cassette subfamily B protein
MRSPQIDANGDLWAEQDLGRALIALAQRSGLVGDHERVECPDPGPNARHLLSLARYFESCSEKLNIRVSQTICKTPALGMLLREPYSYLITELENFRSMAILRANRSHAWIVTPSLEIKKFPLRTVVDYTIRCTLATQRSPSTNLLAEHPARSQMSQEFCQALQSFEADEQLRSSESREIWRVAPHPHAPFGRIFRHKKLGRLIVANLFAYLANISLLACAWMLITKAALVGTPELGWLWAWSLALVGALAAKLYCARVESVINLKFREWLRNSLMLHAMKVRRELITERGSSAWHASLREILGAERTSIFLAQRGLIQFFDLISAIVLAALAGVAFSFVLAIGILILIATPAFVRIARNYRHVFDIRFAKNAHNVDSIRGHATRVMQQAPNQWHSGEDDLIRRQSIGEHRVDQGAVWITIIPRIWLVVGLLPIADVLILRNDDDPTRVLVAAGAYLLANNTISGMATYTSMIIELVLLLRRAFERFSGTAKKMIADQTRSPVQTVPALLPAQTKEYLLEARDLLFGYAGRPAILAGTSLAVSSGDRILITGPSGSGKSTLISILAGLRNASGGTLLVRGFDRQTLGDRRWRRHVVLAPQFHENHIFSETLLFNLVLGSSYPPEPGQISDALLICEELGLKPLIERMPATLMQTVGEPGWSLSHGERTRICLARALLQAPDVLLLDESFGALDPETLYVAMGCVRRRARSLIVVAHP